MDLRLATLKQSLSICCTMFQHWINAERFPVPASWQSVYTQMWHRKPLCIDSVLKHCAANRKWLFQRCQTWVHIYTTLAFLALLGAPYIYDISSLRVKGYHQPRRQNLRQYTYCAGYWLNRHTLWRFFHFSFLSFYLLSFISYFTLFFSLNLRFLFDYS